MGGGRRLVLAPSAEADLADIWATIARDSPARADGFIGAIGRRLELLAEFPEVGVRRDELAAGLRAFPVGQYVVFCRVAGDAIEIAHVVHGARDAASLF